MEFLKGLLPVHSSLIFEILGLDGGVCSQSVFVYNWYIDLFGSHICGQLPLNPVESQ